MKLFASFPYEIAHVLKVNKMTSTLYRHLVFTKSTGDQRRPSP